MKLVGCGQESGTLALKRASGWQTA